MSDLPSKSVVSEADGVVMRPARAVSSALRDMREGLGKWRLWTALAWEDLLVRYRRSYIGVIWFTLSFAIFIGVKVLIFAPLSGVDFKFFAAYLSIGFFAWTFMSSVLVDSTAVFYSAEGWLKGARIPLTVFICQGVARNIYIALYHIAVVICVLILSQQTIPREAFVSIITLFIFVINAFFCYLLLGIITARFADISHIVQTAMRVLFFLTPIFWFPDQLGSLMDVLIYNPFAHYIFCIRDPIIYGEIPWRSVLVVVCCTLGLAVAAVGALAYGRRRVVFWL